MTWCFVLGVRGFGEGWMSDTPEGGNLWNVEGGPLLVARLPASVAL